MTSIINVSFEHVHTSAIEQVAGYWRYLNALLLLLGKKLSLSKNMFESLFIEIDKSVLKTKRNVIIGEIYRPPLSQLKHFNKELEHVLNAFEKEKNIHS